MVFSPNSDHFMHEKKKRSLLEKFPHNMLIIRNKKKHTSQIPLTTKPERMQEQQNKSWKGREYSESFRPRMVESVKSVPPIFWFFLLWSKADWIGSDRHHLIMMEDPRNLKPIDCLSYQFLVVRAGGELYHDTRRREKCRSNEV